MTREKREGVRVGGQAAERERGRGGTCRASHIAKGEKSKILNLKKKDKMKIENVWSRIRLKKKMFDFFLKIFRFPNGTSKHFFLEKWL